MKKIILVIAVLTVSFNTFSQKKEYFFANEEVDNTLKFNFIAPLTGYTGFSFEKYLKPGLNWEAGFGIIGLGLNKQQNKPFGCNFMGGLKIYHKSSPYHSFWNTVTLCLNCKYLFFASENIMKYMTKKMEVSYTKTYLPLLLCSLWEKKVFGEMCLLPIGLYLLDTVSVQQAGAIGIMVLSVEVRIFLFLLWQA